MATLSGVALRAGVSVSAVSPGAEQRPGGASQSTDA